MDRSRPATSIFRTSTSNSIKVKTRELSMSGPSAAFRGERRSNRQPVARISHSAGLRGRGPRPALQIPLRPMSNFVHSALRFRGGKERIAVRRGRKSSTRTASRHVRPPAPLPPRVQPGAHGVAEQAHLTLRCRDEKSGGRPVRSPNSGDTRGSVGSWPWK